MPSWITKLPASYKVSIPGGSSWEVDVNFDAGIRAKALTSNQPFELIPGTLTRFRKAGGYEVGSIVNTLASARFVDTDGWIYSGAWRQQNSFTGKDCFEWNGLPIWRDNYANRAVTEALLKLPNGHVNLGTALGESKQTFNMIAQTGRDLLLGYNAFKRGDYKSAAKHLGLSRPPGKSAANKWLAYHLGWMPLVKDIYGGVQQVQEGFRKKAQIFSVVRKVKGSESDPGPVPFNASVSGSTQFTYICKIYARVKNEDLAAISALGLANPAAIAWELLPYTFILDWLLPVGNMLEAATARLGLEFVTGYKSCYSVANWHVEYDVHQWLPYVNPGPKASGATSARGYARYGMNEFPRPALYVKSPFSTSHVATFLSLLAQSRR